MKIFWLLLYNIIIYPTLFLCTVFISIFYKKVKDSIFGKFRSLYILKKYFSSFDSHPTVYWFHAASLGEFYQVKPVLEGMNKIEGDRQLIVSFSSPSGYKNAYSKAVDLKFYMPFDFPWSVSTALKIVKPKKIIFAAYDYWPNFIWITKTKGIHTNVFAAQFSLKSYKMKIGFRNYYRNIFSSFESIYTNSEKDSNSIRAIIKDKKSPSLQALGNPRYDTVAQKAKKLKNKYTENILDREKRIIIGSAHKEDDKILIPSLAHLMDTYPDLKVLYAPHEPSLKEISRIKSHFRDHKYISTVFKKDTDLTLSSDRLIVVGVLGILSELYWQGIIAYVGGGYSTGVHNVMEPAAANLPVLFGPKFQNAYEAEELILAGGGHSISNGEEFIIKAEHLLKDKNNLKMSSLAAKDIIYKNIGSSDKIIWNLMHE